MKIPQMSLLAADSQMMLTSFSSAFFSDFSTMNRSLKKCFRPMRVARRKAYLRDVDARLALKTLTGQFVVFVFVFNLCPKI